MTLTDGRIADFIVKNGAQGPKGDKGDPGGITDVAASSTQGYITVTKADGSTKQVAVGAAGDFLPLTGGTVTGPITFSGDGAVINTLSSSTNKTGCVVNVGLQDTGIFKGNGDGISTGVNGQCNMIIKSWYGVGFATSCYNITNPGISLSIDTRTGDVNTIGKIYGAVWNDYAECRETTPVDPGYVVYELGDDTLALTTDRMMPACSIVSDTYGFLIGETEKCKTPLAQAGRVLAYPFEDRNSYKPGDAVCSGPNGTVSKMTDDEKMKHPECIIGYISCVPTYETWGEKDTKVDGRVWVRIA